MRRFDNRSYSSDEKVGGRKLNTTPSVSNKGSSADGAATPATVSVSAAGGGDGGGIGIGCASSVPKSRGTSRASKSIKSDNGSLKSSKSRRSSHAADLESLMIDEFGSVKFTGYNMNKWALYHRFHHDVKIIKQKIAELYKTSDAGDDEESVLVATLSNDVSDYWENSMETGNASGGTSSEIRKSRLNAAETQALLILQSQFRLWLELARRRRQTMYSGFDMVSKIGVVQNAIRCFYAVRDVRLAEANLLLSADLFTEFCTLMVAGVQILMYSRKHGTAVKRTIKFTDGMCVCMCVCVCMFVCV